MFPHHTAVAPSPVGKSRGEQPCMQAKRCPLRPLSLAASVCFSPEWGQTQLPLHAMLSIKLTSLTVFWSALNLLKFQTKLELPEKSLLLCSLLQDTRCLWGKEGLQTFSDSTDCFWKSIPHPVWSTPWEVTPLPPWDLSGISHLRCRYGESSKRRTQAYRCRAHAKRMQNADIFTKFLHMPLISRDC